MMRLRWRNLEFAPSVVMTLLTALAIGLFVLLGNWQLQRAEEKRSIEEAYRARLDEPCRRQLPASGNDQDLRYSRVCLVGSYHLDNVVLVDNKLHRGAAGYHVLLPFRPEGASRAVWVNRGWVAAGADRSRLPRILPPREASRVDGVLTIPTTAGFRMGQVEPDGHWPLRVPYIDLQKINPQVEWSMLHYVVWLDPALDDYYERDWKPVWSPPEKSRAYALQWFSFALIALLLFLGLNTRKTDDGKDDERN
jgi:surfeit locus 1 family protein